MEFFIKMLSIISVLIGFSVALYVYFRIKNIYKYECFLNKEIRSLYEEKYLKNNKKIKRTHLNNALVEKHLESMLLEVKDSIGKVREKNQIIFSKKQDDYLNEIERILTENNFNINLENQSRIGELRFLEKMTKKMLQKNTLS